MGTHTHEVTGKPDEQPRRDTAQLETQARSRLDQDRVRDLINALGDPSHPLHSEAVNDLVEIGPAAVPMLSAALQPTYPWLTSYRAAETLAQIGDGRANGALINALRHPNSNVRWSVVRALSEVGDTRTLLALRRVVHEDHGKTSWGESVADTAQLALDRLQSRSALLRFSEPIKTALVFVAMLAVLAFASTRVQALRDELSRPSTPPSPVAAAARANTNPDVAADEDTTPTPTPTAETTPTPSIVATPELIGRAMSNANIRSGPGTENPVVGSARQGDELILLAESGGWYRIRLGANVSSESRLQGDVGYIAKSLVEAPNTNVPTATATPQP
jgi:HEAT repeat protein